MQFFASESFKMFSFWRITFFRKEAPLRLM
jgi:hypothetical protein